MKGTDDFADLWIKSINVFSNLIKTTNTET